MEAVCDLCSVSYDEDAKKPLTLPCGHSACKQCLFEMLQKGYKECAFC